MSEPERMNLQTRQTLMDLNSSLFMSESMENIDLLIPFDNISIGSGMKEYF